MNSVVIPLPWVSIIVSLAPVVLIPLLIGIVHRYRRQHHLQPVRPINWRGLVILTFFYLIGFYWIFFLDSFYEMRFDPAKQVFEMTYYLPRRTVVLSAEQLNAVDVIVLHHRYGIPHYQLRCLAPFGELHVSGDFDESQRAVIERQMQPWREQIFMNDRYRNQFNGVVNIIR